VDRQRTRGIAHVAIDSDNENSTLKRFHPDTRFLNLNNRRELDGIFSALEKSNLVVMDFPAHRPQTKAFFSVRSTGRDGNNFKRTPAGATKAG